MKRLRQPNGRSIKMIITNSLLIIMLVVLSTNYVKDYRTQLFNQNLNDIRNINQAAANISVEFFSSQEVRMNDIQRYLDRHDLTIQEVLTYLDDTNANEETIYELIASDYSGFSAERDENNAFLSIDYRHTDYRRLHEIFDSADFNDNRVAFSIEFSDKVTGLKSFARYIYIRAKDEQGIPQTYTLMAVTKTKVFLDLISVEGGFDGLTNILSDKKGDYILRNPVFKSDNFFDYLYIYNDLTLDQKEKCMKDMNQSEHGTLRYLNAENKEAVFVYLTIPKTDWFCISAVPVQSFHTINEEFSIIIHLGIVFALLMLVNIVYLYGLNRSLKQSTIAANAANEAKTDFLSRMSHDIRTPINVINGMTELAMTEKDRSTTVEYLSNIRASGKFLLGLVNDILDMNKVESGKMELHKAPYSYEEFETYIHAVIEPLCTAKDITFVMKMENLDMVLLVDSLRLNQIMFNLLSNAVKFTPRGGKVELIGKAKVLPENQMRLTFYVKDNGIGMSPEFQKRMFSSFTQEEREESKDNMGTGLGLSIVKKLVELMGGNLQVASQINKGSTFVIELQVEITSKKVEAFHTVEEHQLTGKRILLCEDHPLNTLIVEKMLAKEGIHVDSVENGKMGVERYAESRVGTYDAILMDIQMPVMNGYEATRKIREMTDRSDALTIPIVALTANAYDEDIKRCEEAGMTSHLSKPVDSEQLYAALEQLL